MASTPILSLKFDTKTGRIYMKNRRRDRQFSLQSKQVDNEVFLEIAEASRIVLPTADVLSDLKKPRLNPSKGVSENV